MKFYLFWLVVKKVAAGFVRFYDWAISSDSPRFHLYRSDVRNGLREIAMTTVTLPVAWVLSGWMIDLALDIAGMMLEAVMRSLPAWLSSGAPAARNPLALWITMSAAIFLNRFLAARRQPGPPVGPPVPGPQPVSPAVDPQPSPSPAAQGGEKPA